MRYAALLKANCVLHQNPPEGSNSTTGTSELHSNAEIRTDQYDTDRHSNFADWGQVKIIPEAQKCDWPQYKNYIQPFEKGIYAISALESDSSLYEEIQDERKRRENPAPKRGKKKFTRLEPVPLKAPNLQTEGLRVPMVELETKEITRIRIQSPTILTILAKCLQETWDTSPRTFYRPFYSLKHFFPKVAEALQEMRSRYEDHDEPLESATPKNSSDLSEKAGSEIMDDKSGKEWEAALAELKCYVQFIEDEVLPIYHHFENLSAEDNPRVSFSDLWCLFRVGETVYRPMGTRSDKETDNGNIGQRALRVYGMSVGDQKNETSHRDYHDYGYEQKHMFILHVYYIDFLGQEFCVVTDTIQIEPFPGKRPVNSLAAYPFRFVHNYQETRKSYQDLDQRYIDFVACRHANYNWWTLTITPKGEVAPDSTGSYATRPEFISGEVIIDFVEAFQTCPAWKPVPSVLKAVDMNRSSVAEDFPICWWSDEDRSKLIHETFEVIVTKSGVTASESNDYVMKNDKLLAKIRENDKSKALLTAKDLDADDLAIMPSRLFAYALRERKFVQVDISKLTKVSKINDAFACLKIKPKYKDLVQSLVEDHFRKKRLASRDDISMDWIQGKGKGLFILLHGVPGVGKTATAEAVAQACGKPLFIITCGDLGLTPTDVETALRRIFRLANAWDCVLLLDEVDTFFSQRAMGDATLTKNALVSGALDEAFKSRIHLILYYPPLDIHQTMDIWEMNIERLGKIEKERRTDTDERPMQINEREILRFAEDTFYKHKGKFCWNGRQIRNAFQIASSLAHYDARRDQYRDGRMDHDPPRLTVDHFKKIHTVTEDFDLYMQEAVGKPDGENAFARGERVQDDWDPEQARRENLLQNYDIGRATSPGGPRIGSGGYGTGFGLQPRQTALNRRPISPINRDHADSVDSIGMTSPTMPLPRDSQPSFSSNDRPSMPWIREPSEQARFTDERREQYGRPDSSYMPRGYAEADGSYLTMASPTETPTNVPEEIAVDPDHEDASSDLADSMGPNDERQNEHLDINHEMLLVAMDNKLFYAPIGESPQRVLDVGTGTGIWAIDFAEQFPSAEVIGTDLSPTQPTWVPPNVKFELDDAQKIWTFRDDHFDYIHMRLMMGSIKDWPALYKQVYRCLKPGGWFEHQDYDPHVISDDNSIGPDSAWHQWGPLFVSAGEKLGQTFGIIIDHKNAGLIKDAGFEAVTEKRLKLPLGNWARDPKLKAVGSYNLVATEQGLEGFALFILTQVHGWDLAQTQIYLASVRKELKNRSIHAYYNA
ncbi:Secondary metabolism regulator LAE1 [Paramyrothecium foliicola]|nr:Secondary metabolism regulator LAE1 [Paramyrothecium foliicola]